MKITKLKLKNFRNYSDLDIKFNDKLNIIIGNNAQGKTNILEAIYFLSITKSNLTNNEKNCIKNGAIFTKLEGRIVDNHTKKKLSILMNINGKTLMVNDNEIKKHSEYIGNLKVVIFNPDNIRLIKDAPLNRRKFLNIEISQLSCRYIDVLNEYNIVLKQRNEYLKIIRKGHNNQVYFDILTDKLIDLAVIIYNYRVDFIKRINKYIGDIFNRLADYGNLQVSYTSNILSDENISIRESIRKKIDDVYEKEILNGTTLIGPHRDDFSFKLDDIDLLLYGSQGQQKLAVLALKLAEIDVFYDECGEYPIVLLDDLFSELDIEKRNKVINYLNKDIQTIISTTDLDNIDDKLIKNANIYKIENGVLVD